MKISHSFDFNFIERNGKHYVNITSVRSKAKFDDYFFKLKSDTTFPFVTRMINQVLNANSRLIFAENERSFNKILGETAQAFLAPIFNKFAMQDFFQENCEWNLLMRELLVKFYQLWSFITQENSHLFIIPTDPCQRWHYRNKIKWKSICNIAKEERLHAFSKNKRIIFSEKAISNKQ